MGCSGASRGCAVVAAQSWLCSRGCAVDSSSAKCVSPGAVRAIRVACVTNSCV